MDLKWWPVALAGSIALVVCIALAVFWPMAKAQRSLRPLANVARLTRLPEYARVDRIKFLSMVITGVLLLAVFTTSLLTSARPTGLSSTTRNFESLHPEDIMLCVGEPVTDPTTAGFLSYFANQAESYDKQRIGLTSPSLRVVPMTGDHEFAAQRFAEFAELPTLQRDFDAGKPLPDGGALALSAGKAEFSRSVTYVDYARSVEDILALCMTGFPGFEERSTHRRQLIYLGFSALRSPEESRPALYSQQAVKDMAAQAGVQINVLSRSDVVEYSSEGSDSLESITQSTGGKFYLYNPAGTAAAGAGATEPTLAADLDEIRSNSPDVVLDNGRTVSSRSWDYPNTPLSIALVMSLLLCLSLAVLRR